MFMKNNVKPGMVSLSSQSYGIMPDLNDSPHSNLYRKGGSRRDLAAHGNLSLRLKRIFLNFLKFPLKIPGRMKWRVCTMEPSNVTMLRVTGHIWSPWQEHLPSLPRRFICIVGHGFLQSSAIANSMGFVELPNTSTQHLLHAPILDHLVYINHVVDDSYRQWVSGPHPMIITPRLKCITPLKLLKM